MNKLKLAIISVVTLFFIWVASWFGLFGFINSDKVTSETPPSPSQMVEQKVSLFVNVNSEKLISYSQEVTDKTTAFSILKDAALENEISIDTTEYDFGVFVNAINEIEGNNEMFWKYYVNNEEGTVAADTYILNPGDKVEWVYEEVRN